MLQRITLLEVLTCNHGNSFGGRTMTFRKRAESYCFRQGMSEVETKAIVDAVADQMSHTLPGATEPTLQDRVQAAGYNGSYLGENIAFNYPDANAVMVGWRNSPDHRANILNPNFTQIGVAIA